ncbi:MAG: hypothetical protein QNJ19_09735 [Woeseiaceae bacterium]|nr:hypothetical protein [Woeseiaceae bacterium]
MIALILMIVPVAASASGSEREENCLLGQETAALFYTMLQTDPDQAARVLRKVDTRIAKHAHYWAKSYLDKDQDLHTLVSDYLTVCLRTGPGRMPVPPIEQLK